MVMCETYMLEYEKGTILVTANTPLFIFGHTKMCIYFFNV